MRLRRAIHCCILLLIANAGLAQTKPVSNGTSTAQQARRQKMANDVFAKLLSASGDVTKSAARYRSWPPRVRVFKRGETDQGAAIGNYNAFAAAPNCLPTIGITQGLIAEILQDQPDRMAAVLGHELSHLLLGHVECGRTAATTRLVAAAYTRAQEYAADKNGFVLAMRAGYSNHAALQAFRIMDQKMGYSSFEALGVDHPSFKDRIAQLDQDQASLWRSMSAFQNGAYFLAVQDYSAAEDCFLRVVREFPDAFEAWLDLGYARLMRYADNLSEENVRGLGIGQLAVGGFYTRPATLAAKVRGIDRELWNSALQALEQAHQLRPHSTLVQENFGVAYLVHPDGRPQLDRAIPFLEQAAGLAQKESLNLSSRISVAINLAVAYTANGRAADALAQLNGAAKEYPELNDDPDSQYFAASALSYNFAWLAAGTTDPQLAARTAQEFERYLVITNRSSAWWPIAYQRYARLCDVARVSRKQEQELQSQFQSLRRPIVSVDLNKTLRVTLGDNLEQVRTALGAGKEIEVTRGLHEIRYPERGVSITGDHQVLAIMLQGRGAPALPVRAYGVGQRETTLRIGMPMSELANALKGERYGTVPLIDVNSRVFYFPALGLAVDSSDNRTVTELILARIPIE